MEIYAVILFIIGIILTLYILPSLFKEYNDAKWIEKLTKESFPLDIQKKTEKENIGNSITVEE